MNEPTITLMGHLGTDPELRFTPNGVPVCDIRLATTPRVKVGETYLDKETLWFKLSLWRELAENAATSLRKGDRVVVQGKLLQETYERRDGTAGLNLVVDVAAIGPDLRRCPVDVKRPVRAGSTADVMPEKWVDQATGEIMTDRSAATGPVEPFTDQAEEVAA